jgi:hypothetical protein
MSPRGVVAKDEESKFEMPQWQDPPAKPNPGREKHHAFNAAWTLLAMYTYGVMPL